MDGIPEKTREVRGEQRFASITYSLVAKLAGLKVATIRTYGANGRFPKWDLVGTIEWINARRQAKGLPMIGVPSQQCERKPVHIDANPMPATGAYE